MERKELVLAALYPAKREYYTPVQVQKLLFLIDEEIHDLIGGPYFDFQPYNYGPFDGEVYDELRLLRFEGLVESVQECTWRNYRLSYEGQREASRIFKNLSSDARSFIEKVSKFVRRLSFTELVRAIYKAYPRMRKNSVFQD